MRRCFLKKKQVHASEQKREDVAQARKEWKEKQENHVELPVDKLVFLDESGVIPTSTSNQARISI